MTKIGARMRPVSGHNCKVIVKMKTGVTGNIAWFFGMSIVRFCPGCLDPWSQVQLKSNKFDITSWLIQPKTLLNMLMLLSNWTPPPICFGLHDNVWLESLLFLHGTRKIVVAVKLIRDIWSDVGIWTQVDILYWDIGWDADCNLIMDYSGNPDQIVRDSWIYIIPCVTLAIPACATWHLMYARNSMSHTEWAALICTIPVWSNSTHVSSMRPIWRPGYKPVDTASQSHWLASFAVLKRHKVVARRKN